MNHVPNETAEKPRKTLPSIYDFLTSKIAKRGILSLWLITSAFMFKGCMQCFDLPALKLRLQWGNIANDRQGFGVLLYMFRLCLLFLQYVFDIPRAFLFGFFDVFLCVLYSEIQFIVFYYLILLDFLCSIGLQRWNDSFSAKCGVVGLFKFEILKHETYKWFSNTVYKKQSKCTFTYHVFSPFLG